MIGFGRVEEMQAAGRKIDAAGISVQRIKEE
jgi:hypothetical protein